MSTKLRTIFAAPGGSWGELFTKEEREREIERFKDKLNGIKLLLPNVDFIEEELKSREDLPKLDEDKEEDGILFFSLSGGVDEPIFRAMDKGLPMILLSLIHISEPTRPY